MADSKEQTIDMRELGATGLKRFSGFIYEDFLKELTGWNAIAIYKEMVDNDPVIAAMIFTITMLCRQAKWTVKKASEQNYDVEAANFLESCMADMSHTWVDMVVEILSMLQYGHDVQEIVYKRRCGDSQDPSMRSKYKDGRIGWRKLTTRAQDTLWRWRFDDNGGIQGVEQIAPPMYRNTFIPTEKLLLFRTTSMKNNPEGKSILRGAYRPWYMKKNIENIEAIGIERDLAGLPMAMVPPEILSSNASAPQKAILNNIKEIVQNVRRDEQEGLVFPMSYDGNGKQLYDFKLLSTAGSRQFDTNKIIERYDQRIAMTCLCDFILLGHAQSNGLNLAVQKTSIFTSAIKAYLDVVADVFNRYAVPRLFKMNPDMQISAYPELVVGDVDNVNLNDLGNFVQKLSMAGFPLFPNIDLEKHISKLAGFPEPKSPEDMEKDQSLEINPEENDIPDKVTEIAPDPESQQSMSNFDYNYTPPSPNTIETNAGVKQL